MHNRKASGSGFTLIELMIVVAIIGVLTAIAYPSYRSSVLKSGRAEGKALLLDAANRQERRFADVSPNAYTTDMTKLGYGNPAESENGLYVLSATVGGANSGGFTLKVTAQNAQAADTKCATLSINALGQKTSTGGGDCW